MSFDGTLKKVVAEFSNRLAIDNNLYNSITQELFHEPCRWDPELLVRIEASIVTAKYSGAVPGNISFPKLKTKGYEAKEFLINYFRCLLEIYVMHIHRKGTSSSQNLISQELCIVYEMVISLKHRALQTRAVHLKALKNILEKLVKEKTKKFFCYPAEYLGHSIYINYFTKGGALYAAICNLGAGKRYHTTDNANPKLYYPRILKITDLKQHLKAIYSAKAYRSKFCLTPEKKRAVLKLIYNSGRRIKNRLTPEFAQTPSNCVVKNYLQSLLYRLNDYDKFKEIMNIIRGNMLLILWKMTNILFSKEIVQN